MPRSVLHASSYGTAILVPGAPLVAVRRAAAVVPRVADRAVRATTTRALPTRKGSLQAPPKPTEPRRWHRYEAVGAGAGAGGDADAPVRLLHGRLRRRTRVGDAAAAGGALPGGMLAARGARLSRMSNARPSCTRERRPHGGAPGMRPTHHPCWRSHPLRSVRPEGGGGRQNGLEGTVPIITCASIHAVEMSLRLVSSPMSATKP